MTPIRLGVIGCGVIGLEHLRAAQLSPFAHPVAVADLNPDAARAAAEAFGADHVHPNAAALLADPVVEAVVLALPTRGRADLAREALRRGKHVLLEKPAALNAAELEGLLAVRGPLTVASCSSRFRALPSAVAAAEVVASGELGELRLVRSRVFKSPGEAPSTQPPAWRFDAGLNGGGIAANWASYDLDFLLGVSGWTLEPRAVLAQAWGVPPGLEGHVAPGSDAETHFTALVRCAGGAVLSLERGELVAGPPEAAWQIVGTRGGLRLDMLPGPSKTVWLDRVTPRGLESEVVWQGDESFATVHAGPVEDFAAAIRERRPPRTGLEEALVIQRLLDSIYASAARGTSVEIAAPGSVPA